MSTFNKIKISFMVSAVSTVFAAALKTLAMFFEFDREIGYFNHNAHINLAANIFTVVAVLFFIAFSFLFKKREIFPVINYSSSIFRFFSSTSGCFMLVYAYVKWQEYLSSKELFSNVSEKKVNFLFATAILAAVSGFALMVYAFGKNEKNNPMRSFLAVCPAGVALLRAIEIQFDGDIEMNDPMKISLQLASLALILGIV